MVLGGNILGFVSGHDTIPDCIKNVAPVIGTSYVQSAILLIKKSEFYFLLKENKSLSLLCMLAFNLVINKIRKPISTNIAPLFVTNISLTYKTYFSKLNVAN